jgi:hypothetical protein
MGDWKGIVFEADGSKSLIAAQVIALGGGKYQANIIEDFNKRIEPLAVLAGEKGSDGAVNFTGDDGNGVIKQNEFAGLLGSRRFILYKEYRVSPTLGKKPPLGAVVLFDGKNFKQFRSTKKDAIPWKLVDGVIEAVPGTGSLISQKEFGDIKLHMEFRTPFVPDARGQGRGNSGVYFQGRYEIQILDSYGLEGLSDECGGIYNRWDSKRTPHGFDGKAPLVNAALPPGQWQTYDIIFRAARFDNDGRKITNARFEKVFHNGVMVHDNAELTGPTRASLYKDEKPRGPLMLQGHGNKVQYRNIWVVKMPSK